DAGDRGRPRPEPRRGARPAGHRHFLRAPRHDSPPQAPQHERAHRLDRRAEAHGHHRRDARSEPPLPGRAAQEGARPGGLCRPDRRRPPLAELNHPNAKGPAMIVPFLYELRERGLPVGTQEALTLAEALSAGLHDSSLEGFYYVARATMIHDVAHFDDFDQAFSKHFKGIEAQAKRIKDELFDWLKEAKERTRELSDEERKLIEAMDLDELKKLFEERLREQNERDDGGNKWIGTGGTSPFGHSGNAPQGIRVGGPGGNRSAVKVADARMYRGLRDDITLDTRQMEVALRKLRAFVREGVEDELDLEGTIDKTAANGGEIEVVTRAPRRGNTRVILMMDIGGSMDPYAHLCSRLFSAAKRASHFKELRTYYFHNCVY